MPNFINCSTLNNNVKRTSGPQNFASQTGKCDAERSERTGVEGGEWTMEERRKAE